MGRVCLVVVLLAQDLFFSASPTPQQISSLVESSERLLDLRTKGKRGGGGGGGNRQ
jgi:hypothetical protein